MKLQYVVNRVILHAFFMSAKFYFKINFFENFFQEKHQSVNSWDPDQVQHFVGPGLDPSCFLSIPADDISTQWVNRE